MSDEVEYQAHLLPAEEAIAKLLNVSHGVIAAAAWDLWNESLAVEEQIRQAQELERIRQEEGQLQAGEAAAGNPLPPISSAGLILD